MDNELHIAFQRIEQKIDNLCSEVKEIKRGVHGDPVNKIKGLIDRQEDDERRISKLENSHKKALWWAGGFLIGVQVVVQLLMQL